MLKFDYHRLKELRKQNHLSQQEAADWMHCTASNISRWELGKTPITAEDLAFLADAYGDRNLQDFFVRTFEEMEQYEAKI